MLKFVLASSQVDLDEVAKGITKVLFQEMEQIKVVMESCENQPKFDDWR